MTNHMEDAVRECAQFDGIVGSMTHRKRFTSLAELGDAAAFLASGRAGAMTGAVANLTGGVIAD